MAGVLQSTNEVRYAHVTATAEAFEALLDAARSWPVVYEDTFDDDNGDWPSEKDDQDLAEIEWQIQDGKYHWEASAKAGFVWWVLPETDSVSDFFLAADIQLIEGPETSEMGLVFRSDGESDYYNFAIREDGTFSVYMHSEDGWEALLGWTPTVHVQPGEINRLAVIAKDERMFFFINDNFMLELVDFRLEAGEAGLIIGLSYAGEEGVWEFDNYELRSPLGEHNEAADIKNEPRSGKNHIDVFWVQRAMGD